MSAYVDAISGLGHHVRVLDYAEHALSAGGDALAAAYVECEVGDGEDTVVVWGVGMDANIVVASLKAVTSAREPSRLGCRCRDGSSRSCVPRLTRRFTREITWVKWQEPG